MNDLFARVLFNQGFTGPQLWGRESGPLLDPVVQPRFQITEAEGYSLLNVELPGVPKDQIKIETLGDQLRISGQWRTGEFSRSFSLPKDTPTEKIEADYRDGVLQLYVPHAEAVKPRQIAIGTEASQSFFGKLLGKKSSSDKDPSQAA